MSTRRDFFKQAGVVAGSAVVGSTLAPSLLRAASSAVTAPSVAPMRVLILGGTGFIGPHLVRLLVARGHTVSTFTRGIRQADLPEGVERLVGDRDVKDASGAVVGNYTALTGRSWDAVIDDSATNPAWVRGASAQLKNATQRYMFVSSTGVFFPYRTPRVDESAAVRMSMTEEAANQYGVDKANSEQIARDVFGAGATIVRPSYIVGPGDTTDRFTYWPVRLARGGDVLAPGKPTDSSQFVDVRDLTEFMVKLVEDQRGGTFNVAGPREPLTMPAFLAEAKAAVGPNAQLTWVDDYEFLGAQRLRFACPWILPTGDSANTMVISNARSIAAGLAFRPIGLTVRDTLAWWQSLPEDRRAKNRFVLTPEREAEILSAWKARGR